MFVGLMAVLAAMTGVACPPQDEPFPFQYHGTPTPTPRPAPDVTPEKVIAHRYDVISKGETIKIAEWDDKSLKLLNFLAGYVMVFGLDHAVELVDLSNRHYGEALLSGDVHMVLLMEEDWYETTGAQAGIIDVGTPLEDERSVRIGASPALEEAAPRIVEFLGNFVPGDARVDDLASRITGGRVGMQPNVAGLKYFKEYKDIWTQWVDDEVAQSVQAAIDGSKTGLINRKCIPDGGNENCVR